MKFSPMRLFELYFLILGLVRYAIRETLALDTVTITFTYQNSKCTLRSPDFIGAGVPEAKIEIMPEMVEAGHGIILLWAIKNQMTNTAKRKP
jgi:hypothetical protein